MTIQTLGSELIYHNRWMRLREDRIRRADGSEGIYGVVEKPDYSLVIPIDGDRVRLVEQYRYPVQGRYWEFPQGSWEDAPDADPGIVAAAELQEETGLIAGSIEHLGHVFVSYGYATQGANIFLARDLREGPPRRSSEEQDLVSRWMTVAQFESMILSGAIKDAATLAAWGLMCLKERRDAVSRV